MENITITIPRNASISEILLEVTKAKNVSGWCVIRDAYKGDSLGIGILALIDRSKTTKSWWTSDDVSLMMIFKNKSSADIQAKKLRIGNPRVISFNTAKQIISEQRSSIKSIENEQYIENSCGDYMYEGDA